MVTVINYVKRTNKNNDVFFTLELQGDVELIKSSHTGKYYAHTRRANITSTLNEATCKALIGTKFPGEIKKVECEPYNYQIPGTNDSTIINYNFQYIAENANVEEAVFEGNIL